MTAQQRWTNRTAAKHFHVPRELRDFDFTVQFSFQAGKQNFALTGFETVDDVRNASQIRLHRHDDVFLVHEIRVRHFIDVEIHMGAVLVPIDPNFTLFGFLFVETHVDHVGHFHLPHWIGGESGEGDQITVQIGKIFFRFRAVRCSQP